MFGFIKNWELLTILYFGIFLYMFMEDWLCILIGVGKDFKGTHTQVYNFICTIFMIYDFLSIRECISI